MSFDSPRIRAALKHSGIQVSTLQGGMHPQQRTKALADFQENPQIEVFVVSIGVGGVGLNFTCADTVYIMVSFCDNGRRGGLD